MIRACGVSRVIKLALVALLVAGAARGASVPKAAPSITLRATQGTVALDSLRGGVVLVDFWASWCVPCHKSFPWLESIHKQYRERGLTVLAVNVDKDRDAADRFLRDHPVSFAIAYDPAGKAAAAFGVKGMPSTYLLGRDGRILGSHVGYDPRKTAPFEAAIQEAMQP